MRDSTTTEDFRLIKKHIECHGDRNGWQQDANDAQLLGWAIHIMETAHG